MPKMLIRRKLSLGDSELEQQLIVRHEQFADYRRAVDVMVQARAEAAALLQRSETVRQESLDEALAEFWIRANELLKALEAERQQCKANVIEVCRELLDVVIGRLFDGCPQREQITILLEHLANSQAYPSVSSTLKCHPELFDEVQTWLRSNSALTLWQLQADRTMPIQALRLSTNAGEYDVDWTGLRRTFLATAI